MPDPAESPPTGAPPGRAPSLLPREHGAWGQLALPLLTGLGVGRPGAASLLLCAAAVAAFLAHEPLLVVLGQRGLRARDAHGRRARRAVAAAGILAAALAAAGLRASPAEARLAALPVAALGAAAVALTIARLERTTAGELIVAAALAACAAPVALAGGAAALGARTAAVAWVAAFSAAVLPVRAVLMRARTKGAVDRRPLAALAIAGIEALALVAAAHGAIAWTGALAILPVVLSALAVTALPVRPQRLTAVGWSIVGASVATLVVLVAGLRGS